MSQITDLLDKQGAIIPPSLIAIIEDKIATSKLTKAQIEDVIVRVVDAYNKAKVEPGEGVGVLAAQSIGEPGTQMMMRTKHYAGTAMDVTRGLPRLIEIFDARSTPKTPMMSIYLKKEFNTPEKAEKLAFSMKETKIRHIATKIETNFARYQVVISLDMEELKRRGLTPKKFESVLEEKFVERFTLTGDTLTIKAPKRVASALQKLREEVTETHLSGIKGISYVVIQKDSKGYVIFTQGTNLEGVLSLPSVDTKRTITNDIKEVEKVFGIEAARNMLMYETLATLKEAGLTVDPRHVSLVADTMTADGLVKAIGRHGVSGDKASVLARASFEETVKHLLRAAAYGEVDPLRGVVENIIVGQVISLGTGVPELIVKRGK